MQAFETYPTTPRLAWPATTVIPAMRPAFERGAERDTPIYDALYAEFRRLFRSLPGDRTGEENFKLPYFADFGSPQTPGRHRSRLSLPPGSA
ncbi:hypothetical protein [Streptacidiphilus anmyonensis]|uniref:hypothetical protein n=1 Tax=Streptacidiphilus anmyonensis TaxID=405782 RepID=UPI000694F7A9|nr:hypothetical protein [Streptacidiphilus anmyonensis]